LAQIPSLAEKLGFVKMEKSDQNLDENDWSAIKDKYKEREYYKEPCVICKEQLGSQQQVNKRTVIF
jgi:hypothetical protein